jgi:hypothetical protein
MTHSVLAFARGRVVESFYLQPAAALMCCIAIITAVFALLISVFGINFTFLNSLFSEIKVKYIVLMLIIVLVAGWAVTLARALAAR